MDKNGSNDEGDVGLTIAHLVSRCLISCCCRVVIFVANFIFNAIRIAVAIWHVNAPLPFHNNTTKIQCHSMFVAIISFPFRWHFIRQRAIGAQSFHCISSFIHSFITIKYLCKNDDCELYGSNMYEQRSIGLWWMMAVCRVYDTSLCMGTWCIRQATDWQNRHESVM